MKLALALVLITGCVQTAKDSPPNGSGDGSGSGTSDASVTSPDGGSNEPDLCASEPDIQHAYDLWVATQPTMTQYGYLSYHLDAIIEPGPTPAFAVRTHENFGGSYDEDQFVVALDANGAETGRAYGRYIDRLGPGRFLLDKGYAHLSYVGSHDPLYYVALQPYAADRTGTELWHVATMSVAERSSIYRMDGNHWLVIGLTHGYSDPILTYFDADGHVTPPVAGDPRPCVFP